MSPLLWRHTSGQPDGIITGLSQDKMDPFRQGVTLVIGKTDDRLCPITALLSYMVARGPAPGPLFTWGDKQFFTREAFVAAV